MEDNAIKILQHLKSTFLQLDVILLQQQISLQQLMSLTPGSILTFKQSIKEPIYLSVTNKKFAKGKIVQMGEHYAFRIDEVLS